MVLTIRRRMFINIVQLMATMCIFAWFLAQEVQKQIDFADQEISGEQVQKPLTELLHDVHAHKLALMTGASVEPIAARIASERTELAAVYGELGSAIGFANQPLSEDNVKAIALPLENNVWGSVQPAVDKALSALPASVDEKSIAAHDALAGALKAMILRASDGSNLTLDPDLDSYYVMDALSFAIPNSIDNFSAAQSDLLEIARHHANNLTLEQFAKVAIWKHVIEANDLSRVLGSLNIALAEDGNFYGQSVTLARIKPLMADYENKNKVLVALLGRISNNDNSVAASDVADAFNGARSALMTLYHAAQEEMNILLHTRIESFKAHLETLLIQGGGALLIGFALFWLISRSIVNPINRLRRIMSRIAKGDLSVEIPYTNKRDEIGQIANSVVIFKQNAEYLQKLSREFERSVKNVVEIVASAATEMDSSSKDLTSRAETSYERLQELSHDVDDVLQSLQHVAGAGDQLSASITEISSQVNKSTTTTSAAVVEAGNVKKVAEGMANSAQKVSGIVGIINGIAAKITLLALNATIEAARAGESGKGFAVVASEVKMLANQTANATAEIGTLVSAMQGSSKDTLAAIEEITGVIDEINHISGIIAAAIEEQGAATKDIASHITQASKRVDNITKNVSEVTDSAGHSSAAATQTLQASNELAHQSEYLRREVSKFLSNMAASS